MKKNLILMSALFAGSMFMNNGFGSNDGFGGNYVIDIDDDQNDEEFNPPEDINDDDYSYNPSKEEFFNDIETLYHNNIKHPIVRTDIELIAAQNENIENPIVQGEIELNTAQNNLKKLIETEYSKLSLTKRINKKIKKFAKKHKKELITCGTLYAIDSIINGIKLYKDLNY